MINIGIIGCGGITAFTHIPQLLSSNQRVNIKYLCDTKLKRAERIKERYFISSATCIDNPEIILTDKSISAVIVSTWPTNICNISIDAIKYKKHTLIQKPLFATNDELTKLTEATRDNEVSVLALPLIEILTPFRILKEYLKSGKLGSINFARIRTTIPGPLDYYNDVNSFFNENIEDNPYKDSTYAHGRGALSDMGPYALSTFHYLFGAGELISSIQTPNAFDYFTLLTLRSEFIPICSVEIGWNQIKGQEICGIYGSEGTAIMQTDGSIQILKRDGSYEDLCNDLKYQRSVMLPVSPFEAQQEWLKTIATSEFNSLNFTVERAKWVTNIINEAYK